MLQDLGMLPVRDPSSHFVERAHTTVYTDESAGQVLIVYTPTSAALAPHDSLQLHLEFIAFTLQNWVGVPV